MIYFVHHVPETINVSRISANLAHRLETQMRELIDGQGKDGAQVAWPKGDHSLHVQSQVCGYIQTCNFEQVQALADQNDWHIEIVPAVGDFVTTATDVFAIWSDTPVKDGQIDALQACFAAGIERTENQNPTFLALQLVEMIARALSPGVNDPYTATDCLNRLSSALTVAYTYKGGLAPQEVARLRHPHLTFDRLFAATFPLCRQYICPDDICRGHAMSLLESLDALLKDDDKAVIRAEMSALKEGAG